MEQDLRKLRALVVSRLGSGVVPNWSWDHHAALIEAIDAVIHDERIEEVQNLPFVADIATRQLAPADLVAETPLGRYWGPGVRRKLCGRRS